jgi:hypothetical protein
MILRFSKYSPTADDLIFSVPLILERDYKALRAELASEPDVNLPKKYNDFLSKFVCDAGDSYIHRVIEVATHHKSALLTMGIYIPRHYTMLDTLYNVYRQIVFCARKMIIREEVDDPTTLPTTLPTTHPTTLPTIRTSFYRRLTELVNALTNNPRMTQKTGLREPIKGYNGLWKGKQGLVRQSILGKRTCFNGRSVIVPDPSLKIHQVKLPDLFRLHITTPHVWTEKDKSFLYTDVRFVESTEHQTLVPYRLWLNLHGEVPVGTVVHRDLRGGDWVLVNRQPSLRLQNILYLEVARFGDPGDHTIGINLALTEGFGADFDGDEMNIFVPQSRATHTVCRERLTPNDNRIDQGTGKSIWAHVQDVPIGCDYMGLDNQSILRGLSGGNISAGAYESLQRDAYKASTDAGFSISFFDLVGEKDVTETDPYGNWSRMVRTGAKGKQLNLDQMRDSVGLLLVNGHPVPEVNHVSTGTGGVIGSSYSEGLTLGECVQHAMAAWEAMITSAVQTAQSGYRGRIMNYALMNLVEGEGEHATRIGLQTAIILGQTLTQSQLSSFHSTGQEKLRSSLADTVAYIESRKGGPVTKMILTPDTHVLYSFERLGGKFVGRYLVFPVFVAEAYHISTGEELDFSVVGCDHSVTTSYGDGQLVAVLDHGMRAIVHVGSFMVHTGYRSLASRRILANVEVMISPNDAFLKWYMKQTPDKVLRVLYCDYIDASLNVICSDVGLVEKYVGWKEAKHALGVLLSSTAFGQIDPKYMNVLVDALFADETYGSITRHGNLYKGMGVVAQALMECPYTRFKEAAYANTVDHMKDMVDDLLISV